MPFEDIVRETPPEVVERAWRIASGGGHGGGKRLKVTAHHPFLPPDTKNFRSIELLTEFDALWAQVRERAITLQSVIVEARSLVALLQNQSDPSPRSHQTRRERGRANAECGGK